MARTERVAIRPALADDPSPAGWPGAGAVPGRLAAKESAAGEPEPAPTPLLFLISDTGGGHRTAAVAVQQALDRVYPGQFAVTLYDPLGGPDAARLLRWVARLYGPVTRQAPWLWGAAYYLTNSRAAVKLLGVTLLRLADRPVVRTVTAQRPAAIVSFHPLTGLAAVRVSAGQSSARFAGTRFAMRVASTRRASPGRAGEHPPSEHRPGEHGPGQHGPGEHRAGEHRADSFAARAVPVVTVVTDLGAAHASWWHAAGDLTIVPPGQPRLGRAMDRGRHRVVRAGPPAGREFWAGPVPAAERAALRRALGSALQRELGRAPGTTADPPRMGDDRLLIVLTGGGEGCGGIGRRAAALLRRFADVQVVAVCGRNDRLRRRLLRRASRVGRASRAVPASHLSERLIVTGYTHHLPALLRCADLVVTKAGPGTITEATCCGAPLLLTAQLPGQERRNAGLVIRAGAGRRVPGVRRLVAEVGRLRDDRAAIDRLRAASARLGRPGDTRDIARLIADLASRGPATGAEPATRAEPPARAEPVTAARLAPLASAASTTAADQGDTGAARRDSPAAPATRAEPAARGEPSARGELATAARPALLTSGGSRRG